MKFELQKHHRNESDEELLSDLKLVYQHLNNSGDKLTYRSYDENGKYSAGTISRRFGGWNKALQKCGLDLNQSMDADEDDLMVNIKNVWLELSRQPVSRDMKTPLSKFGYAVYKSKFGSWRKALEYFVDYINNENINTKQDTNQIDQQEAEQEITKPKKRRTSRQISERMRFRILMRDGFVCQTCGASPIKSRDVELHVDHILPWSKDGESTVENLQTKCSKCNLGKGNAFSK